MASWPNFLEIGPFQYGFKYNKVSIEDRFVHICSRASEYAKPGEVLVITLQDDHWVAYDGEVSTRTVELRQPVFRSTAAINTPGWYVWEINVNAARDQIISSTSSWRAMGRPFETRAFSERPGFDSLWGPRQVRSHVSWPPIDHNHEILLSCTYILTLDASHKRKSCSRCRILSQGWTKTISAWQFDRDADEDIQIKYPLIINSHEHFHNLHLELFWPSCVDAPIIHMFDHI